ncbi:hypothetical protein KO498_08425 [Lentibacter algarum]|uniref:hypothetical protein n=1 Tax=Lentibacter algarum TaxID=576131 RepID=UPI001C0659D9|nr:hypothetical protein [Lentibacter algarum]MBU2981839.1 hypothetical protein [Lentibacter algarum]
MTTTLPAKRANPPVRGGIPRFVAAEDKPWGVCELVIVDHDGNLLRIGHLLE